MSNFHKEMKLKYEQLYKEYRDLIMSISFNILKKKELAEDATHDSLIKMMKNIEVVEEIKCHKTKSWVVIISKRTAYDKLKYEKRRYHEKDDVLEYTNFNEISIEDVAIQNITVKKILKGLKMLDQKYYEVIIFRYYFGYSSSQLAKHFMVSDAAIRKRCERGKKMLMKELILLEGDNNEKV